MANVLGDDTADPEMPMPQRMDEVWRRFPTAKIHPTARTAAASQDRSRQHVAAAGRPAEGQAGTEAVEARAATPGSHPISWSAPAGRRLVCVTLWRSAGKVFRDTY